SATPTRSVSEGLANASGWCTADSRTAIWRVRGKRQTAGSTRWFRRARQAVPGQVTGFALVGVESQADSGQALVQLLRPAGCDDRRRDAGLLQDPGERHLHKGLPAWLQEAAQVLHRFELRLLPVALAIKIARLAQGEARSRGRCLLGTVLAAEEPPGQ